MKRLYILASIACLAFACETVDDEVIPAHSSDTGVDSDSMAEEQPGTDSAGQKPETDTVSTESPAADSLGTLEDTEFDATETAGSEDVRENTETDSVAPDFHSMTWAQIFAYAQTIPGSQSGCTSDDDTCNVTFLPGRICTSDNVLVEASGWCDEGGEDGYYCSPNHNNCRGEAAFFCEAVPGGNSRFMANVGECVIVLDDGPTCMSGTVPELVMDCSSMIGNRYCSADDNSIQEILEVDCVPNAVQMDEEWNYWLGCVPNLSVRVAVCDDIEVCEDDYISISLDESDESEGIDEEGPYARFSKNAQCVTDPCLDTDPQGALDCDTRKPE